MVCVITKSEYDKVHSYKIAKEICNTMALAHEGSSQVKESKISMLVHHYELLRWKRMRQLIKCLKYSKLLSTT